MTAFMGFTRCELCCYKNNLLLLRLLQLPCFWALLITSNLLLFVCSNVDALDAYESRAPGMPTNVLVEPADEFIQVAWSPPTDANKVTVRGYTVGWGTSATEAFMLALDGDEQRDFTIHGVEPLTDYVVSVRAYNDVGDSEPVVTTTKTLPPSDYHEAENMAPPFALRTHPVSSDTIELSWSDPSEGELMEDVQRDRTYSIRWGVLQPGGAGTYQSMWTKDRTVNVSSLKPFTEYEFAVKIIDSEELESPWSLLVTERTTSAAPSSPPFGFKLIPVSDSSDNLNLTWKPPVEANGVISAYELFWTKDSQSAELSEWSKISIFGNVHSTFLKDLPTASPMYFKMRAVNEEGPGPFSAIFIHRISPNRVITEQPVIVSGKPRIWIMPNATKDLMKHVGDMLSLLCQASTADVTLSWYFPNGSQVALKHKSVSPRVYSFRPGKGKLQLVFVELRTQDAGKYKCSSSDDSKDLSILVTDVHAGLEPDDSFRCAFERNHSCGWFADVSRNYEWKLVNAANSLTALAPRFDHTISQSNGHFLLLSSPLEANKGSGRLFSPLYPAAASGQTCFSLWYFVGKNSSGSLTVQVYSNDDTFSTAGQFIQSLELKCTMGEWKQLYLRLPLLTHDFRISLEATKNQDSQLILAIDDIDLMDRKCSEQEQGDANDHQKPFFIFFSFLIVNK